MGSMGADFPVVMSKPTIMVLAMHFTSPLSLLTMRCSSAKLFSGREEVAVYIGDNYVDMSPVDTFRHHILKIAALSEVEKLDIYRVIEVTEQVDVVEAYLQGHLVPEGKFRHGHSRIRGTCRHRQVLHR